MLIHGDSVLAAVDIKSLTCSCSVRCRAAQSESAIWAEAERLLYRALTLRTLHLQPHRKSCRPELRVKSPQANKNKPKRSDWAPIVGQKKVFYFPDTAFSRKYDNVHVKNRTISQSWQRRVLWSAHREATEAERPNNYISKQYAKQTQCGNRLGIKHTI